MARAAEARRPSDERPELHQERSCYVCKKPFAKMHRYYDSMCDECGDFNYAKREQTADLSGHYALVTGARVKIGFQKRSTNSCAPAHTSSSPRDFRSTRLTAIRKKRILRPSAGACKSTAWTCATHLVLSYLRGSWF